MGQPGLRLRLSLKAKTALLAGELVFSQDLDGDLAVELLVVRGVDRPHASAAEFLEHREPPEPSGGRGLLKQPCPDQRLDTAVERTAPLAPRLTSA